MCVCSASVQCVCSAYVQCVYVSMCPPVGKLYLYELRSLKTPKSVTEAHQTAVTRIAPQTPLKVPTMCVCVCESLPCLKIVCVLVDFCLLFVL